MVVEKAMDDLLSKDTLYRSELASDTAKRLTEAEERRKIRRDASIEVTLGHILLEIIIRLENVPTGTNDRYGS